MTHSKKSAKAKPEYQPTAEERSALNKFAQHGATPSPRVKVSKSGSGTSLAPDHPDERVGAALLAQALGTMDVDFIVGLLLQLADAGPGRDIDEPTLNFLLSAVKGVKPRDEVEAMLAAQMAAVHMATMTFARRLAHVENIPQQDSAERAFNKLARTFATQMEALKRYRTGGEQKVTVQHVSVSEGGQAIVGNVTQTPREKVAEKAAPAPLPPPQDEPMPMLNKSRKRVPRRRLKT